jgi:hypothetical protein
MRGLIVASVLLLAATTGAASVLGNMDFSSDLTNWYTANGVDWNAHPQTPGTVHWSSEYDGSAKMVVSGAPSSVDLFQGTREMLYASDKLVIDLVAENMTHATFAVQVGTDGYGGQSSQLTEPADGSHQLVVSLNGAYGPGTVVQLVLVCWPGENATCYVTNISSIHAGHISER